MRIITVAALASKTKTSMANINRILDDVLPYSEKLIIMKESEYHEKHLNLNTMSSIDLQEYISRMQAEVRDRLVIQKQQKIIRDIEASIKELKKSGLKTIVINTKIIHI